MLSVCVLNPPRFDRPPYSCCTLPSVDDCLHLHYSHTVHSTSVKRWQKALCARWFISLTAETTTTTTKNRLHSLVWNLPRYVKDGGWQHS